MQQHKPRSGRAESRGRPTIKMIAGLAGVAPSTVSRAINEDPSISKATRRRIARIADRLGFVPNVVARGLVTRRSSVVAFVLGSSPNPHYMEMIPVLSARLAARHVQLMIFHLGDGDRMEETLAAIARHQVSGCVIASASLTHEAAMMCSRFDIPIVLINRLSEVRASSVSCNNQEAGQQVAKLLAAEGRTRLAYVGGETAIATPQDADREAGFARGAAAAGLAAPQRIAAPYGYGGGLAAAERILAARRTFDGIFVANDVMAFGVLDGLRRGGVHVPRDLSLVGFDDLPQAQWRAYDLTTVRQPIDGMVERSLAVLDRRLSDPQAPVEAVFLPAELVRRGTTR